MCLALLVPFFALYGHDVASLDYNGKAGQNEHDANERESRHYLLTGEIHLYAIVNLELGIGIFLENLENLEYLEYLENLEYLEKSGCDYSDCETESLEQLR